MIRDQRIVGSSSDQLLITQRARHNRILHDRLFEFETEPQQEKSIGCASSAAKNITQVSTNCCSGLRCSRQPI